MTFPLGLTALELAATEAQMLGSYRSRVLVGIMDFQHQWVVPEALAQRSSGAVQVKADPEGVTRSLAIDLWDPTDMLNLGTGADAAAPNRMISVRRGIYVDSLSRWVDIPVFLGPITKPDWADDFLSIEAQDKTRFALSNRSPFTIKAGTNLATAMRQVMTEVVGETRLRISTTTRKLTKEHNLSPDNTPWQFIQKLCRTLGWVAFYDAAGHFVARPRETTPAIEFRKGPGGALRSTVKAGYWSNDFVNRVIVTGKTVGGATLEASATLPDGHKLSAYSLRVGSKRMYYDERVEDTDLGTLAECKALAEDLLAQRAIQQTTMSFSTVAFWHLQEYDPYLAQTQRGMVSASFTESTVPLGAEEQTYGFLRATPRASKFRTTTTRRRRRK